MKLLLVAVGQRLPAWAQAAYAEFERRFPPELRLELHAVKAPTRDHKTVEQLMAVEAERLEAALPRGVRRVVLDEHGTRVTTRELADRLTAWLNDGRDVALLMGGPDGLDPAIKRSGEETLRLSDLTLPHALARVLLAEALYRAWSLTVHHPYHRE